ncbi:MAG TPA: hypothetical protein VLB01_05565 [Thermodesulfobacteriota bacterium]|nr:hypothetical protein [Thermodesulfobacteriota bacterium]
MKKTHRFRFLIILLGGLALISALWAGLLRLGWNLPSVTISLPLIHGPLMVSGFLGTLISLERAVALGHRWSYIVPLLSGIGGLVLIIGVHSTLSIALITSSSIGLAFLLITIFRRHLALYGIVMILGAFCWCIGNTLWLLGFPFYQVSLWWTGFLILTIAGERLEMSRVLRLPQTARAMFAFATFMFISGAILSAKPFSVGGKVAGAGMIILAAWLLHYDVARRTAFQAGLARFIAVSLLLGYVWLGIGGILELFFGGAPAGFYYDAILHSVFVGFVFSMIFAHAPIIIPSVLNLQAFIPFHPLLYVPLIILHTSLAVRVIGDLAQWLPGRKWGGLLNAVAILLFMVNIMYLSRIAKRTTD